MTEENAISETSIFGWNNTELIETREVAETIEMIYKHTNSISNLGSLSPSQITVFKIIFSCIDGKWNKSQPIYGKVIPEQKEYYQF